MKQELFQHFHSSSFFWLSSETWLTIRFFFFSLLFLASKMKFSRTNHNVTNTWNVNSLRLYVAVSPPVHSSLKKGGACHAAACLLIYSSHPQPFRRWASANIDALHVTQLNEKKNKAPVVVVDAPCWIFYPWRCERPLRGSRITRQLLFVQPPPPLTLSFKMHLNAQTLLILLTYEWP